MGLIDQLNEMENANEKFARNFNDLYQRIASKSDTKFGGSPGNPIYTDDVNLNKMPNLLDNMYGFLRTETMAHYRTMDSKLTVTNKLIGELIDVTYKAWGETPNFDVGDYISESNSELQTTIQRSIDNFSNRMSNYQKSTLDSLRETLDDLNDNHEKDKQDRDKKHKEIKNEMRDLGDTISSKVGSILKGGFKTIAGAFTDKLLTYGTNYYDNEFTSKISDTVESVESKMGSGLEKLGQMTSGLTSGLKDVANSITGGLGNLMDMYTDPQVQKAFAKYGSSGIMRAQSLFGEREDLMKELTREYGYSIEDAKKVATQEMTRTGTRDYSRITFSQKLSDQRAEKDFQRQRVRNLEDFQYQRMRNEEDYQRQRIRNEEDYVRSIQQRREQEEREWQQSALLSAVEIFKNPKQIDTAKQQIYEIDRIMPGLNFQATEFYQTMISVFDETGQMSKEMFEEIRDLSKNLMVDPQTILSIGDTYTKYIKLMTKGGLSFQKQMTNVVKVTAKLEDQFIDAQGVFGEVNEIGFTMLSDMSDELLTKTQLYARELGMSVTELQRTAQVDPSQMAEMLLGAKRGYTERMGISAEGGFDQREMALLQQIGITGFESITEFLGQSTADLSKSDEALAANQGIEKGPLERQIQLENEAYDHQIDLMNQDYDHRRSLEDEDYQYQRGLEDEWRSYQRGLEDTAYNRRMDAWETEQEIRNKWENEYFAGWEKRQLEMDKELLENGALDEWNDRLLEASMGLQGLGDAAKDAQNGIQATSVAVIDGVGSLIGNLIGSFGGNLLGKVGSKFFGRGKGGRGTGDTGGADTGTMDLGPMQSGGGQGGSRGGGSVDWQTIAKDFTIVAGGIALVAGTVAILGKIDPETFKTGAKNARLVGEGFAELYEPVGIVLGSALAIGGLMNSKKIPMSWKELAGGIGVIAGGIMLVSHSIKQIGSAEPGTYETGAENARYIGEGMRALYEPVGIVLAASAALGLIMTKTPVNFGAIAQGLGAIEAGIVGVAAPIGAIGAISDKYDPDMFKNGAINAEYIGDAFDALKEPVGVILGAAAAIGTALTIAGPIGWLAIAQGIGAIEGGIASIAVPIGAIGKYDTSLFQNGAINAQYIGNAMNELYEPLNFISKSALKLSGISFLTGGIDGSLEEMRKSLNFLADMLHEFGEKVVGINPDMIASAAGAGQLLNELVNNMPRDNKWVDLFVGEQLSGPELKENLVNLGEGLKAFSDTVKDVDAGATTNASNALELLFELQEKLPQGGGFLDIFTGKKQTVSDFSKDLVELGKGLGEFGNNLKDLNPDVVDTSKNIVNFVVGIDFDKITSIDGDAVKSKLMSVADGIKAYDSIDFTEIGYTLDTKLDEFINNLNYDSIGATFRSKLQQALTGDSSIDGSTLSITVQFSDLLSDDAKLIVQSIIDNTEELQKLIEINTEIYDINKELNSSIITLDKSANILNTSTVTLNTSTNTLNTSALTLNTSTVTLNTSVNQLSSATERLTSSTNSLNTSITTLDSTVRLNTTQLETVNTLLKPLYDELILLQSEEAEGGMTERTTGGTGGGFNPFLGHAVTSGYGWRTDPFTGSKAFHYGIDYAFSEGEPVPAVANSIVSGRGYDSTRGNWLRLSDDRNNSFEYDHLQQMPTLQEGSTVTTGSMIGYAGNTGRSDGVHLHFEVSQNGKNIDPQEYFQSTSKSVKTPLSPQGRSRGRNNMLSMLLGTILSGDFASLGGNKGIDAAVSWALGIANDNSHGYDMNNRWGPDYDCSSLVISAYRNAGIPVNATYTGDMLAGFTAQGFQALRNGESGINFDTGAGLRKGDILLNTVHHTELMATDSTRVGAHDNYDGRPGDSSGDEISIKPYGNYGREGWDYVLRPSGSMASSGLTLPSGRHSALLTLYNKIFNKGGNTQSLDLDGSQEDFVNKMLPFAQISANLLGTTPGTLLAQWALESGWGTSEYARNRNNFAGINAIDTNPDNATSYTTVEDFAREYARFIGVNSDGTHRNTSYMRAGIYGTSGSNYYSILKQCGYATSPNYVAELTDVYNRLGVHQTGLSQVPYDNYVALLHKDERVLNSTEARLWNELQESKMGNYEPSIQDVNVYVDTDAVVDSISTLTDVVEEIYKILKPKNSAPVQQVVRPTSNLITQYT